ncbi:hypothetical protein EZS27_043006, partial [termite gut metagenome]
EQDKKEENNGQHFSLFDQVHITSMSALKAMPSFFSPNPTPLGVIV